MAVAPAAADEGLGAWVGIACEAMTGDGAVADPTGFAWQPAADERDDERDRRKRARHANGT